MSGPAGILFYWQGEYEQGCPEQIQLPAIFVSTYVVYKIILIMVALL
jgi:hypothetical protein